jgi:hypothetical protein
MAKPRLIQQVFEARYDRGYRFLDRCGEAMLILEEMLPAQTNKVWMFDEATPNGTKLKCPELDVYVVFGMQHLAVDQNWVESENAPDFVQIAQLVYSTLTARFDIKQITRLGFRRMHLRVTDSVEEAEAESVRATPLSEWPAVPAEGLKLIASEATVVVEDDEGSGYRLGTKPISRIDAPLQADPRLRTPPRLQNKDQNRVLIEQMRRLSNREKSPAAGLYD